MGKSSPRSSKEHKHHIEPKRINRQNITAIVLLLLEREERVKERKVEVATNKERSKRRKVVWRGDWKGREVGGTRRCVQSRGRENVGRGGSPNPFPSDQHQDE